MIFSENMAKIHLLPDEFTSGGTRALASARDFFLARFSLQTTPVLRVKNVISIHGWSEMKTVLQEIASTREC